MDSEALNIQWFPGHMAKARRMIAENLKLVDIVCEIADARIPESSRNPELSDIIGTKPRLLILNRIDLADPEMTKRWNLLFKETGIAVLETDAKSGRGMGAFHGAVRSVLKERISALESKGQSSRPIRAMIVGIPNVGKSTFINKISKRKAAAVSDRPGVTRGKQWINAGRGLELLDTPGLLWPKFETREMGENLAFTGAVRDQVVDIESLATRLISRLMESYRQFLELRYKLEITESMQGFEILENAARKRGFLIAGGKLDTERMAAILLDEFRGGVLGRITLESPH